MRSFLLIAVAAASLASSTLFAAADPAAPAAPAASTAPAAAPAVANITPESDVGDPDQIICRMGDPPTGSRLGATRECHSKRDWDRKRAEAEALTRQQELHGAANPIPGG